MTDTFMVTCVWLSTRDDHHVGSGGMHLILTSESGQVEVGTVYPAHLDGSVEDHAARRIRELFNVGLCHGWHSVYTSPSHSSGREAGMTCVWEFDFDSLNGSRSGDRI